jgi:branched-chain amino acid aminotransferase
MISVAWWDRRMVPLDAVRLPIDSAAARYSQVVFDGCAANVSPDGQALRILDLAGHLARFRRSCEGLGLTLRYSDDELREAVVAVCRRCPAGVPVGLRLFAFTLDEDFVGQLPASVCVFLRGLSGYAPDRPLRLAVADDPRPARTDLPRWLKATAHYAGARRAVLAAKRDGYDDALFRNESGRVTETSRASLLIVHNGQLVAPPAEEGVLPGITRELVAHVARVEYGLEPQYRPLALDEVLGADGVLLCSSSLGTAVVGEIAGRSLDAHGIAASLAASFARAARGESDTLEHAVTTVALVPAGRAS